MIEKLIRYYIPTYSMQETDFLATFINPKTTVSPYIMRALMLML